jgi:hypothetical protein
MLSGGTRCERTRSYRTRLVNSPRAGRPVSGTFTSAESWYSPAIFTLRRLCRRRRRGNQRTEFSRTRLFMRLPCFALFCWPLAQLPYRMASSVWEARCAPAIVAFGRRLAFEETSAHRTGLLLVTAFVDDAGRGSGYWLRSAGDGCGGCWRRNGVGLWQGASWHRSASPDFTCSF